MGVGIGMGLGLDMDALGANGLYTVIVTLYSDRDVIVARKMLRGMCVCMCMLKFVSRMMSL